MLMVAVENFVLFSTLLALAGFIVAFTARSLSARQWWRPHPHTLARLYSITIFAPPVVAAWLVAAALLPESWLGQAAFDAAHPAPHHELHLLGDLTAQLEPALAYLTFSFLAAAAFFAAFMSLRSYSRVGGVIKRLEMSAAPPPPEHLALVKETAARYGLDVGLVMSSYPFSFVWGYRRSKLLLSSGLLCTLTLEELAGVLEHEAAHHARRDNLVKLILSICSYTSLAMPLSRLIYKWRSLEVEMICDEVAVSRTSSPLEIAEALVKLRRRTLHPIKRATSPATVSGFISDDTPGFTRRVRRLVGFADSMPSPAQATAMSRVRTSRVLLIAALFTMSLAAVSTLAPLAVHHAAESIIQIFR